MSLYKLSLCFFSFANLYTPIRSTAAQQFYLAACKCSCLSCYNLVLGVTLLYSLKRQSMIIVYLSLSLGMFLNNEFCQAANSEIFLAGIK